MKLTNFKLILLQLLLIGLCFNGLCQSFTSVFHEYDDFPNISEVVHGDFNNDGNLDFIVSAYFNNEVKIGIGNGIERPIFITVENAFAVYDITAIDFDSDGDLDFLGSAPFESDSYVWLNDGAANFVRQNISISSYASIHFSDINNNGSTNAIVGSNDKISIYDLSQGDLVLVKTIFDDEFSGGAGAINSIDYDMDGDLDLIVAFSFDGLILFRQGENFDFTAETLFAETFNDDNLHAVELNGDGILDFVLQSNFERKTSVLLSNASTGYSEMVLPKIFGPNLFTDVADFQDDGKAEILHADGDSPFNTGISIFSFDEVTGQFDQNIIEEAHSDTEGGGVADIDGDGDLDIYIYTNDFFDTGLVFYLQEGVVDADGDGYNSDNDCDDTNADINPGQTEIPYNGLDDDCNSATLDDDIDQDGFILLTDCDDTNADINPGQTEIPYNGLDDDCDSTTYDDDIDQDGFVLLTDCDDNNANINPDAIEIPNNGIDEDCDGMDLLSSTHNIGNAVVNIYPSPATDIIYFDVEGQIIISVSLYDLTGKLIKTASNSDHLNVTSIPIGTYILELTEDKSRQKIVERIVISR